jgi:hypothetical protein
MPQYLNGLKVINSVELHPGILHMTGDATVWDDLRISGASSRLGATAPSLSAFLGAGGIKALTFDSGQHDEVHFEVQLPHNWKEGSNIYPHVHWTPTTADAGNVVWQLDYTWASHSGTFGAAATMASAATAAGGTAWVHKMTDLLEGGKNYIAGTGQGISSMLVCRLHRDAGKGADTLAAAVAFLEFDVHFEIDTLGSRTPTAK